MIMLEIIENRISCICAGNESSKPVADDIGKNFAVSLLPPGFVGSKVQEPMHEYLGIGDSVTLPPSIGNQIGFYSTLGLWQYETLGGNPSYALDDSDIAAINARLDNFFILTHNDQIGIYSDLSSVESAIKSGDIILSHSRINLVAISTVGGDIVYAITYIPPDGVSPFVQKTNAADQAIFGKLISVTPDGTKCNVAVQGKNILFAGGGDDQSVDSTNIGRGIKSTTTVGKVDFGGAVGSRDSDEVGHVVGGTNDNIRVDLQ